MQRFLSGHFSDTSFAASAAITVNDAFQPYYREFDPARPLYNLIPVSAEQLMPDLLGMLSTPMDKDHRMLKAVGVECAAFIGLAAGKQVGLTAP